MSKFFKVSNHLYIAENQNGFNNALYDYFGSDSYTKKRNQRNGTKLSKFIPI